MSVAVDAGAPLSCSGAMYCGVPASGTSRRATAVAIDHHVRGLEIAVNHSPVVGGRHACAQLPRDGHGTILRKPADAPEQRSQIVAVDVLHREEAPTVGFAQVVETTHVLMRDLPRDPQLVVELREPRRVAARGVREELQRDRLVEREVVRAVDLTHPAAADQRDNTVPAGDDRTRCVAPGGAVRAACRRVAWLPWVRCDREIDIGTVVVGTAHYRASPCRGTRAARGHSASRI